MKPILSDPFPSTTSLTAELLNPRSAMAIVPFLASLVTMTLTVLMEFAVVPFYSHCFSRFKPPVDILIPLSGRTLTGYHSSSASTSVAPATGLRSQ